MLITVSNYKLQKAATFTNNKFKMAGLSLAPASQSGYNVCPSSTDGCRNACVLWFSGRMMMPNVRAAMIKRTKMFFEERDKFKEQLYHEAEVFFKYCTKRNIQGVFRTNIGSDLAWEKLFPELFQIPNSMFIDYTKIVSRFNHTLPANYELTYSVSEKSKTEIIQGILDSGRNVAVVLDTKYHAQTGKFGDIPPTFWFGNKEYETVDGDKSDLRTSIHDGKSKVVCLRFKGGKKRLEAGIKSKFVRGGYSNYVSKKETANEKSPSI